MDRRRLVDTGAAPVTAWLAWARRRGSLIVGMRKGTMLGGTILGVGTSEWSWLIGGAQIGAFMGDTIPGADSSATKFSVNRADESALMAKLTGSGSQEKLKRADAVLRNGR